jgi:purine-nucleoside phosphorylase
MGAWAHGRERTAVGPDFSRAITRMTYFDQVNEAADFVRSHLSQTPDIAIVLGSGLGAFADRLQDAVVLEYTAIPHWPESNVIGHAGRLVVGQVAGRRVAVLSGRAHFYEGHPLTTVTFATRVLGRMGVRTLLLTNAAGGINTSFSPGTLMVIDDHINLMGSNPLVGPNDDRFGLRFPDMTDVYSPRLRAVVDAAATAAGVAIRHGVYVALHGPSYETPAEIRFLRGIGADAVGMSTVPEAIVARHMGLEVLGISCITNPAAGVLPTPLDHREVMDVARRVGAQFIGLLEEIVARL